MDDWAILLPYTCCTPARWREGIRLDLGLMATTWRVALLRSSGAGAAADFENVADGGVAGAR